MFHPMAGGSPRSNAGSDDDPTENQINASESPRNHLRRRTRTQFEFGFQTSYRVFIIYTRQRLRPSATAGGQGGGETNQFSGTPRDSEHFKEGASQKRPSHGPTHANQGPGIPGPGTTHRGPPRAVGVVPMGGPPGGAPDRGGVTAYMVDFYQVQPKKKIFFVGPSDTPGPAACKGSVGTSMG